MYSMLPIHARSKTYPHTILDSDTMVRAHRLFARHSKSRTSLTTGVLLLLIVTYLLWPSKIGLRDSLDFFSPDDRRPDYKNWPKERRAEAVREAFVHAYSAYETYAMPADELRPLRNSSIQKYVI